MFDLKKLLQGSALPLVLIGGMALPMAQLGCSGTDVRNDPEFQVALELAEKIKGIRVNGVTEEEEPVLAELLADFNVAAESLDEKLAKHAADIKASADKAAGAAEPFLPPPFNSLVDPVIAAALYFYLRFQNKGALDKLKAEVLGPDPSKG